LNLVTYDNVIGTYEVQCGPILDEKVTQLNKSHDDDDNSAGKRNEPATFVTTLEGTGTVCKGLMRFDVGNSMVAMISKTENKIYRKKQTEESKQLTVTDVWNSSHFIQLANYEEHK
jgi:hypothetical protein